MNLHTLMDKLTINKYSIGCSIPITLEIASTHSKSMAILEGLGLLLAARITSRQNVRYDRLVRILSKRGFNEKILSQYMSYPCGRSLVHTTMDRTGYGDKYEYLKKKYPCTRVF